MQTLGELLTAAATSGGQEEANQTKGAEMENFKDETIGFIENVGKRYNVELEIDEAYFSHAEAGGYSCKGEIDWDECEKACGIGFEYDDGYGMQYWDGFVTFKNFDGWMERKEYDGQEWWDLIIKPKLVRG